MTEYQRDQALREVNYLFLTKQLGKAEYDREVAAIREAYANSQPS